MNISGRNVNSIFPDLLFNMKLSGKTSPSRNGEVLSIEEPTIIKYSCPEERVLFWDLRDANPFFHLMEALWMFAGRDDLAWPNYFNSRFKLYSDDGYSIHGAYGHRWRFAFSVDQLYNTIALLSKEPTTRRAVISMWSPTKDYDIYRQYKDIPCNTHIYFRVVDGRLDMTVCNRSNDLVWGACGSNVVHFSMLQEFIARAAGFDVGYYYQFTNNLHIYKDVPNFDKYMEHVPLNKPEPYALQEVTPYPILRAHFLQWMEDLRWFFDSPGNSSGYYDPFFPEVVVPMFKAWECRKSKKGSGLEYAEQIKATDWQRACVEWIKRREEKDGD